MNNFNFKFYSLLILTLFCINSCGVEKSDIQDEDLATVPILEVQSLLEITETDDVLFSSISGLVRSDSDNNLFIGDRGQKLIFVFDDSGQHIDTFGGEGSGPGEFKEIQDMHIGYQSDTLFIFDRREFRVNRFHRDSENNWNYTNSFTLQEIDPLLHQPGRLIHVPDTGFLLEQTIYYILMGAENPKEYPVTLIDLNGNKISDEQFRLPLDEIAVNREGGAIRGINFLPFGRKSILKVGPEGHLYHNWTDQLEISQIDLSGDTISAFSLSIENPQVEAEEKQYWIDAHIDEMHELLRETIPATKPIVEDFYIDEEQRIWVNIHSDISEDYNWLVLENNGDVIGGFSLPENIQISDVRHGNLYGAVENEETGELSVLVYNLVL